MANSKNENFIDPRTKRFREEYQGKHFFTKDGREEFEIIDARTYGDVDIKFINSGLIKNTKVGNIKIGLSNPFNNSVGSHGTNYSPICFDTFQHQYNGCVYRTNEGYNIKIINYINDDNVQYKFLDNYGYEGCTTIQNIRKGQVKNPYSKDKSGGFSGPFTIYNTKEYSWLHSIWRSMLLRATGRRAEYAKNYKSYLNVKSYENIAIDPTWFCYNTFAEWYMNIFKYLNHNYIYNVDKDLLFPYYSEFTNGRKAYSPLSCVIIPKTLNIHIANYNSVSKKNKERMMHELDNIIELYLDDHALDLDSYKVIKRFYIKDPEYSDYVTERYPYMYTMRSY